MSDVQRFTSPSGREIAYHQVGGDGPGVVFLGGFKSDMDGTKAVFLQDWAQRTGRAFLRFDYSGHGQSSGRFKDGCISDWAQDAADVIAHLTEGSQILVGSSMGGWISTVLFGRLPGRIAGFVGIAAAPDFTEDSMWAGFNPTQRDELEQQGRVLLPSDYGEPYVITRRLIEDGRNNLVLRRPLAADFPVRLLQGTADAEVEVSVALRLLEHISGTDVRLTLVRAADHRFSSPACLNLIVSAIGEVTSSS